MATNGEKMIELVRARSFWGVPEGAAGLCTVQDEEGRERLRLGFDAHRDAIAVIGYEAAPETGADVCAALAALCGLALDQPVLTAYNDLDETALAAALSDDGTVDEVNRPAVALAVAMLREAIRVYARAYAEKKARGEEWHGNR